MLFLTIVMGGLFWVAYWYVKFNWTPPQSWTRRLHNRGQVSAQKKLLV
jgi:hypothetical protein